MNEIQKQDPESLQLIISIHKVVYNNAEVFITLFIALQAFIRNFYILLVSGILFGFFVYFSQYKKTKKRINMVISVFFNFSIFISLCHVEFTYFQRVTFYFFSSDLFYSLISRKPRKYYLLSMFCFAIAKFILMSFSSMVCFGACVFIAVTTGLFLPRQLFTHQKRIRLTKGSWALALVLQILLKQPIQWFYALFSILLLLNAEVSIPPLYLSKYCLGMLAAQLIFFGIELYIGIKHHSLSLIAQSIQLLMICLTYVSKNIKTHKELDISYSYGYLKLKKLVTFSVLMISILIGSFILIEGLMRSFRFLYVDKKKLIPFSIAGFIVNSIWIMHNNVPLFYVVIQAMSSLFVIITSFLIMYRRKYFLDSYTSMFIGVVMCFQTIPYFKELINDLLLSTNFPTNKLKKEISKESIVSNLKVWDLNHKPIVSCCVQAVSKNNDDLLKRVSNILYQQRINSFTIEFNFGLSSELDLF